MRMVFWSGAAFYNSAPNLFAEINLKSTKMRALAKRQ